MATVVSLFISYYTGVEGKALFLLLDCSTPLDLYLIMLSVKKSVIKYHFFWVFGMIQPGIEPWFPRPLVNTLPTRSMDPGIWQKCYFYKLTCGCMLCYVEPTVISLDLISMSPSVLIWEPYKKYIWFIL